MDDNVFPLQLVAQSQGMQIIVETKAGSTYNGTLDGVDKYLNVKLINAVETAQDGSSFHRLKEITIKGFNIKYIGLEDSVLDKELQKNYNVPKWFGQGKKKRKGGQFTSLQPKKN